ncbi:MAG: GTP 3',8-cyclase MoaA [Caulobacterales bacterium]
MSANGYALNPLPPLIDPFGRSISYVRVSVTDRCDLRCVYCMAEHMTFLPKKDVLSLEELDRLCSAFIALGTRKIRLTGGEPLVRKGFLDLVNRLSRHLQSGALEELTLTTNGTRLVEFAEPLARAGIKRINVSIDSLDPERFREITRGGDLGAVLAGLEAARTAGLAIKINTVALRGLNDTAIPEMVAWAHGQGHSLTLIEAMPLGEVEEDRSDQFLSLREVRATLESFWRLEDLDVRTGGPARYVRVAETGGQVGFITPLTHNFCESCNRVRVTCTGMLFMCLGQDDSADLRDVLRASDDDDALIAAIREAITRKPKGHDFAVERLAAGPAVRRHMSMTGG